MRRERCSAGTAPLKRGDWGNLVTPGPSGALAFGASSARARPRRTAATGPGGGVDGAGRQGARNGRALLCQPVSLSTFATWLCRRLLVRAVWACTRCLSPHWVAQLRLGLERKGDWPRVRRWSCCGGRARPLRVARVTRSSAIGAQRSQASRAAAWCRAALVECTAHGRWQRRGLRTDRALQRAARRRCHATDDRSKHRMSVRRRSRVEATFFPQSSRRPLSRRQWVTVLMGSSVA